jgi:sulfite reductase (NADPH) flavoprotein alpha-component
MVTVAHILDALPSGRPFDALRAKHANLPWNRTSLTAHDPSEDWDGGDGAQTATRALYVFYGSETGNAQDLAHSVASGAAAEKGLTPRVVNLAHLTPTQLAGVRHAIFIEATTGLGDPAQDAEPFFAALMADDAPALPDLEYGVLAMGDRVYPDFCAPGVALDARLAELGGQRVVDLTRCDVEYEATATRWLHEATSIFDDLIDADGTADDGEGIPSAESDSAASVARTRPHVDAVLEDVRLLTDADPFREIVHYTLAMPEQTHGTWEVGDSIDLLLPNDPALVAQILEHLGIDPDQPVPEADDAAEDDPDPQDAPTITSLLTEELELRQLSLGLLQEVAAADPDGELAGLLAHAEDDPEPLAAWRYGKDLLAVLQAVPAARLDAPDLLRLLRPLQGRAYSIASSPRVDPARIDLTVRTTRYDLDGRELEGSASGALAHRTSVGSAIPVRLRPAPAFHLPEDPSADVIMVGPGVGIAPFRGFLQERAARGDSGRSWLFCGIRDPHEDGLYLDEFEAFQDRGVLTYLDVAASRVAENRQYVQHVIDRRGEEIVAWLQGGASLYVCGDASGMAPAVREAIRQAAEHTLGGAEKADEFLSGLDADRRYRQDVY